MSTPSTYFGKVPFHGDFLGLAQPTSAVRTLDEWFQGGLLRIREGRKDWRAEFDAVEPSRFVLFSPGMPGPFAGMVWPSRDRTDRRYPFVIGVQVHECPKQQCWPAVPLALDLYLMAVEFAGADDWSVADLARLRKTVGELVWNGFEGDPVHELQAGLDRAPADGLWRDLPGFAAPGRRCLMLQDVRELASVQTPPRFVFRIPCRGDAISVGFWLSLMSAWSPRERFVRLVLWSQPEGGSPGVLRILMDELSPRYFEPTLWPLREHDQGFDLAYRAGPSPDRAARAQESFGGVVERSQTLGALLQNAARVAPAV